MSTMPHNAIQDAGGSGSLITGALLYAINRIHIADINDWLIILTTLGGLVWLIYRIIGQRLDNKIKRKELEDDYKERNN